MANTNQIGSNNKKSPDQWNPANDKTLSPVGALHSTSGVLNGQYRTLSYPAELGNERYPYYMMFYINASSKSTLVKNTANTNSVNVNARSAGQALSQDKQVQAAVNAITPTIAGAEFAASKKRLTIAMALPMPMDVNFGHSANYDLATGGTAGTYIKAFTSEGQGDVAKAIQGQIVQDVPTMLANIASKSVGAGNTGANFDAIKNKILGIARNERKEQVFRSMEPRTFQFSWLLIPKTQKESDTIYDIIKFMKYNQYPEINPNTAGLNVIIPNEVDIEFHNMASEMQGIAKISTCVIDSVNVNYTPLGKFVAFDGTDNPVGIALTIVFKEIEPLTREMIAKGY